VSTEEFQDGDIISTLVPWSYVRLDSILIDSSSL
jgi:hypothetical protein